MVVLVRCNDETYTVALESSLEDLANGGLISAYLCEGEWISVDRVRRKAAVSERRFQVTAGLRPAAAC
jgi:hypothetical protein